MNYQELFDRAVYALGVWTLCSAPTWAVLWMRHQWRRHRERTAGTVRTAARAGRHSREPSGGGAGREARTAGREAEAYDHEREPMESPI